MRTESATESAKSIRFSIDKDHYRRVEIEDGVTICHLYPTLASWIGRETPDDVNPRSHEEASLRGSVAEAIENTIRDYPEDFYLANRGSTILAKSVSFNPSSQLFEIILTDYAGDSALHGIADGGTTDAIIARVQQEVAAAIGGKFNDLPPERLPHFLKTARVHLEVIVGLDDKDIDRNRLQRLVQGRNTSRQVKAWTINDFKGTFDWIKSILDSDQSPFKRKIGYEENAAASVNILEVLAILTLFHPMYDAKGKAPTVAYSSKGRMDQRLTDEKSQPGYRALAPLLEDILKLHDHVYQNFHAKYKQAIPGGKLGRRGKNDDRIFPKTPKTLPLTGETADYQIPTGILYPLLASLRALVRFPSEGSTKAAKWRTCPFKFFDENGAELMENLIAQLEVLQNNPQTMGKTKTVYIALHDRARLLLSDSEQVGTDS